MSWKYLSAVSAILATMLLTGCDNPADDGTSPGSHPFLDPQYDRISIPEVTYDSCQDNVAALCTAQSMYYGAHNCYASQAGSLYELLGETLVCPWVFEQYEVTLLGDSSYWIQCTEYPVHPGGGPGTGGGSPPNPVRACRSCLLSLATSEAMFYGAYNRYGTMEELVEGGFGTWSTCPGCGLDYLFEVGIETYTITCPMPQYPLHGSVEDGMFSWQ